jgi:hypothetical protein
MALADAALIERVFVIVEPSCNGHLTATRETIPWVQTHVSWQRHRGTPMNSPALVSQEKPWRSSEFGNDDLAHERWRCNESELLDVPVTPAMLPESSHPDRTERAFALFYTGTIGAGAIAPVIYGFLGDRIGVQGATFATATASSIFPLAIALRSRLAPA